MTIDLMPFCYPGSEPERRWLRRPFSFGDFTYAADGWVLARVPRIAGAPVESQGEVVTEVFNAWSADLRFLPLAALPIPPARHAVVWCTDPDWIGGGLPARIGGEIAEACRIFGVMFDLRFIRRIAALPDAEIAVRPYGSTSFFRFAGGVGAVMPCGPESDPTIPLFELGPPTTSATQAEGEAA